MTDNELIEKYNKLARAYKHSKRELETEQSKANRYKVAYFDLEKTLNHIQEANEKMKGDVVVLNKQNESLQEAIDTPQEPINRSRVAIDGKPQVKHVLNNPFETGFKVTLGAACAAIVFYAACLILTISMVASMAAGAIATGEARPENERSQLQRVDDQRF